MALHICETLEIADAFDALHVLGVSIGRNAIHDKQFRIEFVIDASLTGSRGQAWPFKSDRKGARRSYRPLAKYRAVEVIDYRVFSTAPMGPFCTNELISLQSVLTMQYADC